MLVSAMPCSFGSFQYCYVTTVGGSALYIYIYMYIYIYIYMCIYIHMYIPNTWVLRIWAVEIVVQGWVRHDCGVLRPAEYLTWMLYVPFLLEGSWPNPEERTCQIAGGIQGLGMFRKICKCANASLLVATTMIENNYTDHSATLNPKGHYE